MNALTLKELAELVGGEPQGDPGTRIEAPASLEDAGPGEVAYLSSPRLEPLLKTSKAGCVLLDKGFKGRHAGPAVFVEDPKRAFNKLLRRWEGFVRPKRPAGVHPTAVVDPYATLGKDVHVGPHVVVEAGARLGDRTKVCAGSYVGHGSELGEDCLVYPNVVIRERVRIGKRVILHSGAVLGSDGYGYLPTPQGHEKIPQIGRVELGDDVEIGANVAVDRATTGVTRLGRGTKVDNLVQVAHNVRTGEHCLLVAQSGIAGSSTTGDWLVLAGQAAVADHVKVGHRVVVGAQSGLMPNSEVPDGAVMFGSPARPYREAMKLLSLMGRLPELFEAYKKGRAKGSQTEAA